MKSGIYKITNNLNNHFYIGQSIHIQKRWKEHKKSAFMEKNHYTTIQKAFRKYGIENFTFEVEECPIKKLDEREVFYIATLKPEYNMNEGGSGNKGYNISEETKKILSKSGKSQWNSYDSKTKERIIKNQLTGPRKESHRSEETKKLLSEKTKDFFRRNNGMSKEVKSKISNALKGKKKDNYKYFKSVVGTSDEGMKIYYPSVNYANILLNLATGSISRSLKSGRAKAGGFKWEYCSQETIQSWSRGDLITSRSAMHPTYEDEDIVHTIAKNRSYGDYDKGLITLARRSKTIKTIAAECIYENDTFDCNLASGRSITHKMNIFEERGAVIGYYCLVELTNGGEQFAVMSKKDAEKFRDTYSKSYIMAKDKSTQNWGKNFDAMALKTCVIKALKLCPISIEALRAVQTEEAADYNDEPIAVTPSKETPKMATVDHAETVEFTVADNNNATMATQAISESSIDEAGLDAAFENSYGNPEDIL